ncbi:Hypothetical predicted protein [Olea europaea subsp. europaea]|uniref:Uncharacterized protein n=1 Tax=Olea europaea subsp. europaea TaxID=158383 RepID=A0A8S0SM18_OLEEU|nr:Hypothetical predicted protein [Olea europaea subsp. europaea]
MAGWLPANQESKRADIDLGFTFSYKSGLDLMQNCDLPPPIKLFAGPVNKICNMEGQKVVDNEVEMSKDSKDEKLEILKALRLSQTRAREAERKCSVLLKERDAISNLLLDESLRLFAYKQWLRLLEFQVSKLEREQRTDGVESDSNRVPRWEDYREGSNSIKQYAAVAFCLAIAGMGLAIGCSYIF